MNHEGHHLEWQGVAHVHYSTGWNQSCKRNENDFGRTCDVYSMKRI